MTSVRKVAPRQRDRSSEWSAGEGSLISVNCPFSQELKSESRRFLLGLRREENKNPNASQFDDKASVRNIDPPRVTITRNTLEPLFNDSGRRLDKLLLWQAELSFVAELIYVGLQWRRRSETHTQEVEGGPGGAAASFDPLALCVKMGGVMVTSPSEG